MNRDANRGKSKKKDEWFWQVRGRYLVECLGASPSKNRFIAKKLPMAKNLGALKKIGSRTNSERCIRRLVKIMVDEKFCM